MSSKKRYVIAGILSEDLSGNIREIERRLKVYSYDMEYGNCYHMELVNKIYERLLKEGLFTEKELWRLLYNLEHEHTIIVYYKNGLINQYLNKGKLYQKIIWRYGGIL
jgi:chromosome condensin MukBEF MukE localization factor